MGNYIEIATSANWHRNCVGGGFVSDKEVMLEEACVGGRINC